MLPLLLALQLAGAATDRPDRIDTLQKWVAAVEQHQAGERDTGLETVRQFETRGWEVISRHMPSLVEVIGNPKASVFLEQRRGTTRIPQMSLDLVLTAAERSKLRALADDVRSRGDANRFLKRAAILHTDLALTGGSAAAPSNLLRAAGLSKVTVVIDDGQTGGRREGVDQWAMARLMVEEIRSRPDGDPDPQKDLDALLWYQATTAYLLSRRTFQKGQSERAVELFPGDAVILFAAGAATDMAASTGTGAQLRRAQRESGSQAGDLRQAAAFYRRALAADGGHAEARIRLAYVRIRQGEPREAAEELRRAIPLTTDPLLRYFAHLFMGRALADADDVSGARAAYERALELAPAAQAPRVGLSQLSMRAGESGAALESLRPALEPEMETEEDPMWTYYETAGRQADLLMERAYRVLGGAP